MIVRHAGRPRSWRTPCCSKNCGEKAGGERPELLRVGGPDGRCLRHQQPLDEVLRVAAVGEELAQRGPAVAGAHQGPRLAIEAERGPAASGGSAGRRRGRPCEQPPGPARRPFELAAPVGDREAHVGRLGGDPELVDHPLEVGVVAVVEDDEPGVDWPAAAGGLDVDRVGVALRGRGRPRTDARRAPRVRAQPRRRGRIPPPRRLRPVSSVSAIISPIMSAPLPGLRRASAR